MGRTQQEARQVGCPGPQAEVDQKEESTVSSHSIISDSKRMVTFKWVAKMWIVFWSFARREHSLISSIFAYLDYFLEHKRSSGLMAQICLLRVCKLVELEIQHMRKLRPRRSQKLFPSHLVAEPGQEPSLVITLFQLDT